MRGWTAAQLLTAGLVTLLVGCGDKAADEDDGSDEGGGWDLGTGADSGGGPGSDVGGIEVDVDGDGYSVEDDCDDEDPAVHPGADERCDGIDNDCDDEIDEDGAVDAPTWCQDGDGDGYGGGDLVEGQCRAPGDDWFSTCDDCDDSDAAFHPGAPEDDCTDPTDYDCDGETPFSDADGDGVAACEDCDDHDASAFPGGSEVCDGADNDCDGRVDDEDELDAAPTWYVDRDGDGYGSDGSTLDACEPGDGWVDNADDCDDRDPDVSPAATEICDDANVDEDCDGDRDDADPDVDSSTMGAFYSDEDGDGHGDVDASAEYYCDAPSRYSATADDCDDDDPYVSPSAAEVCDAADVDEDCDGLADDDDASVVGATRTAWYPDDDDDGHGDRDAAPTLACDDPGTGRVADASDCDDGDGAVHPGATEVCDDADADEDCDGAADDADADVDPATRTPWYADRDGDGHASEDDTESACDAPGDGWSATPGDDCDDGDASIHPGATELCNEIDEDCDTSIEGASGLGYLRSSDGRFTDYSTDAAAATASDPLHIYPSGDGVLYLCEGTWPVEIELGSLIDEVEVVGIGDRDAIVLTNGTAEPVLSVSAVEGATLTGFTIDGGDGEVDKGAGIYVYNCGDVVIDDVELHSGSAGSQGGGIYAAWTDSLTLRDSWLHDNVSAVSGGGISIYESQATVERTTFSGNHAGWGGGLVTFGSAYGTGTIELTDVLFEDNRSTEDYGSLYLYRVVGTYSATADGLSRVVSATGGGIMLLEVGGWSSSLELDNVDFGTPGSDEENDRYDIKLAGGSFSASYGSRGEGWSGSCHTTYGCE